MDAGSREQSLSFEHPLSLRQQDESAEKSCNIELMDQFLLTTSKALQEVVQDRPYIQEQSLKIVYIYNCIHLYEHHVISAALLPLSLQVFYQ